MKKDILLYFPHIELTCFALLLFFSSFMMILIYAFHTQNKAFFKQASLLPLEED